MTVRSINAALAATVLAVAAGCASTSVSTIPYPNVPVFPPTDAASVQILRVEPARPHIKLGEITVAVPASPAPSVHEVDNILRTAAARLGADAAVLVVDPIQPTAGVASGNWWHGTSSGREAIAVAVKYR